MALNATSCATAPNVSSDTFTLPLMRMWLVRLAASITPGAVTPQSPVGANGIVGYTSALPSCSAILCAR